MTIECNFEELKRMSAEFIRAAPTLNLEELDNGFKCFGIAYLGCTFPEDFVGDANRIAGAPALFRIVSREFMKYEFALLKELNE